MVQSLPNQAEIVIIGGGIMGCSLAYHLSKLGRRDVVVLEQNKLTSGTTWHAAGLVGQLRNSANLTRLAMYGVELYPRLEEETGQATGFRQNGAITCAASQDRFFELKRHAAMAATFGVECHVVGPNEIKELYPLAEVGGLAGGIWLPKDGQTNPIDTTQALAKGARMGGARIVEGIAVESIEVGKGAITGVVTEQGRIACEKVAICAGMWSRDLAKAIGVALPLHAAEHMYIVTEPMDGLPANAPVLRDYDHYIYVKEDAGKLLVGGFEPVAKPWGSDGIPRDHEFGVFPEDWEHFEVFMEGALELIPPLEQAGIRQFLNGAECFTPDNNYMIGETPEVKNLFVGCGFNSIGIASSGGAGRALAEWMEGGEMPMDLWDIDVRRVHPSQMNIRYLRDRTVEALGLLYAMHWPFRQHETARGLRLSPFHERHQAARACFGVTQGWERPMWFAPEGVDPTYKYSYGPQNWWPHVAEECRATREAVAVFDQTPFAKFLIEGPDAESLLQRLAANDVSGPIGKGTYTQLLNQRGGIEADLTITRLAEERFAVITGAAVAIHDLDWIRRNTPADAKVTITDVTTAYATLGVMGPKSRDLLAKLTNADLAKEAFPFGSLQQIDLGYARVMALRVSYVGELGWELYIPSECALGVYDLIMQEGAAFGVRPAGVHAMDSLRLEKGFKHWGHDLTCEDTPLDSGLGFAVAFDKNVDFIGREALLRQKEEGIKRRLVMFTVEEGDPLLLHEEPIYRDGVHVGSTTSGGRAFTFGKSLAFGRISNPNGTVDRDYVMAGSYEIDVAGVRYPAKPHLRPLYDPKGERMRA